MPTYYHNPENALKRANEFCALGKDDEASQCLFAALKNRKSRIMKHVHETIINKLIELCVKHRKSQMAKDGLYNYRSLCQGVNIKSWEDSVCNYLKLAESKVESAQEAFHSIILDIDDLDQDMTPEFLLKCVSSEDAQDRKERIILLPWIKFLWECYRNCLDLLRNTPSVRLYHAVAKNAFAFCVRFNRKSELRKLCGVLKMHATYKQNKQFRLKSDDTETHLVCLDTGFIELDSAIKMELWQDAFKAIEDIHALINAFKNFQHSKIMAHYYKKISCVFWKGGEYIFHAAANLRYFLLVKEQKKNLNSRDITKLASLVILSLLAIPPASTNPITDYIAETDVTIIDRKNKTLSSLLHLSKCPTRESLIKDAVQLGIIQYIPAKLYDLFQIMENYSGKTLPSISESINFVENWSDGELQQYIPLLQKVFITKLLPLLSSLYTNININKLLSLTGMNQTLKLEIMLVDSCHKYEFPLKIDHRNMCVHFSSGFYIFRSEKIWDESLSKDLQPETCLRYLMRVNTVLKRVVKQINPDLAKNDNKIIAETISQRYVNEKESYRKSLLQRKTCIEKYKESLERSRHKKEEAERRRAIENLLKYEAAEKERLLRETEERELQRIQREQKEIKRKLFLEKIENFKKSALGSQIIENLGFEDIDSLDPQVLFSKQVEQLNKEKQQLNKRLKGQERNIDHLERSKRIEEIPLLIQQYEKQKEIDVKTWNEHIKNKIEAAFKKRDQEMKKKKRVLEIKKDLQNFLESVKQNRLKNYREEMAQFTEMLKEEKKERLKKRAEERKQKRKEEWIKYQKEYKTVKVNNKTEIKVRGILKKKDNSNQNLMTKNIKDQNVKTCASPKKSAAVIIVDEAFGEEIKSNEEKFSFPNFKKVKYNSSQSVEEIHFSKDSFYYKRVYKSKEKETRMTEIHEQSQRASILSNLPTDSHMKTKPQSRRSDLHDFNNKNLKTNIFENNNKSLLSWRTPWSQKNSYTKPQNRETPPQKITILRRDVKFEATDVRRDKKNLDLPREKFPKPDNRRSDNEYSCTPWAKLKRQTQEK